MGEYSPAKTGEYPRIFPNFQNCARCVKDLKDNKDNIRAYFRANGGYCLYGKYSEQHNQSHIRAAHDGKVGCNTVEDTKFFFCILIGCSVNGTV